MIHPVKYQPIRFFPDDAFVPPPTSIELLRLPTESEWNTERLTWNSNDNAGAFGSPFKFTASGYRNISGSLSSVGSLGFYWSSTISATDALLLGINNSSAFMYDYNRAYGSSVRLIVNGEFTQQEFDDTYLNETLVIDGITYGYAYNSTTNRIWLDRNLGATQVATSSSDSDAYGWLFQWGRLADGHQLRNSSTTATLSSGDVPGNSDFITVNTSPNDWRDPQNDDLWQGVDGINVPK